MKRISDGVTAQVRMDPPDFFSPLSPTAVTFQEKIDFSLRYIQDTFKSQIDIQRY